MIHLKKWVFQKENSGKIRVVGFLPAIFLGKNPRFRLDVGEPKEPKRSPGCHPGGPEAMVERTLGHSWNAKCPIFKAKVAGFRGKVA